VDALRWYGDHPAEVSLMRAQARLEYETKYTAERNYVQMMDIYESVLHHSVTSELVFPAGVAKTI
jgi:hypothetical protein